MACETDLVPLYQLSDRPHFISLKLESTQNRNCASALAMYRPPFPFPLVLYPLRPNHKGNSRSTKLS